jgi:hypothetical protein
MTNPKTGKQLQAALQTALPEWKVEIAAKRTSENRGALLRLESPTGNFVYIASKDRSQVVEWDCIMSYHKPDLEFRGTRGFAVMVNRLLMADRHAPLGPDGERA